MRKSLGLACIAVSVVAAVSGCTGLEWFRADRVRAERQRVLQLYGDCLQQAEGDMRVVAKYCTASADSRFVRERETPRPLCPVTTWLCRFVDY